MPEFDLIFVETQEVKCWRTGKLRVTADSKEAAEEEALRWGPGEEEPDWGQWRDEPQRTQVTFATAVPV